MHILIADDDAIHCCLLQAMLARWGHWVTMVQDGDDAWSVLRGPNVPQVALLDWNMPGASGIELCTRLRRLEHQPYIYVMLLTMRDAREDLVHGLQAGADDYLVKPVDVDILRARLTAARRVLDLQSRLTATQEELRHLSGQDSLTGLFHHAAILKHVEQQLDFARLDGTPLGLVLADLEHLGQINEAHGSSVGDMAIWETARRITGAVHNGDLVGRYSGTEFLIVQPSCSTSGAQARAVEIRNAVCHTPMEFPTATLPVTLSVGAVSTEALGSYNSVLLLRAVETALSEAKRGLRATPALTQR